MSAETLGELFRDRVEQSGDQPALWFKESGEFVSWSWNDVSRHVGRVASWLESQGVYPGDKVGSFAPNRAEWIIVDLAILAMGAVHVPIHSSLTGSQAAFQLRDSEAKAVAVDGRIQLERLSSESIDLPTLVFDATGQESETGDDALRLTDFASLPTGQWPRENFPADPAKEATILYTSGTTGEPKGVVLSHGNLVANTRATLESIQQGSSDRRLCFLPLSHIFARTCDLYTWVGAGSQLALAESRETVLADCQATHPTILNGVPYFFDRVARFVNDSLENRPGALREVYGNEIRFCCSGGAALPDHLFDFYSEQGVPLLQGYGLTETSPVISLSSETVFRRGSVGKPLYNVEVRIATDGEILTRGPHVMQGYYCQPSATADVMDGDWLRTGDLGHLDEDGYLYITGRKKELIVTSGGKNIAPVFLENLLTEDPLIDQAVVIGDDEKYLVAFIVANAEAVRQASFVSRNEPECASEAVGDTRDDRIDAAIKARLGHLSKYEQVQRFVVLDEPFTIENGLMTPKLSLRRGEICARYADCIDRLYGRVEAGE